VFWRVNLKCWTNNISVSRRWRPVKSKPGPGCLHSHCAVKFLSVMMLFGGEREGQTLSEVWRFHFGRLLSLERSLNVIHSRRFCLLTIIAFVIWKLVLYLSVEMSFLYFSVVAEVMVYVGQLVWIRWVCKYQSCIVLVAAVQF
jgi:hypothetical protein